VGRIAGKLAGLVEPGLRQRRVEVTENEVAGVVGRLAVTREVDESLVPGSFAADAGRDARADWLGILWPT
jgi:hypothetical protein